MKRVLGIPLLVGIALLLSSLSNPATAAPVAASIIQQETPPPGNLILDETAVFDAGWIAAHPNGGYFHYTVTLPGPGVLYYDWEGDRLDASCEGFPDPTTGCGCDTDVRFFLFDDNNQEITIWQGVWVEGGLFVADADPCRSSLGDMYEYRVFIKAYFDPDPDMDKVPNSRDMCPGTPAGASVDERGCSQAEIPAPTVTQNKPDSSATETPVPGTPQLLLSVSPNSFHELNEEAQLTVTVLGAQGAPMAGELVQLTLVEPQGGQTQDYTDANGVVHFTLSHVDEGTRLYTYYVTAAGLEQWFELPVVVGSVTSPPKPTGTLPPNSSIEIQVEQSGNKSPYKGISADGITAIQLIAKFPAPMTADQISWTVSSDTETEPGFVTEDTLRSGGQVSVVEFRPTEFFSAPFTVKITASITAPDGQVLSDSADLNVVRPPVLLIHGIWSDATSMIPMRSYLVQTQQFYLVRTVDYGSGKNQSIQDINLSVSSLANGVDDALQRLERDGIKAARVDIAAHSMGGLVSRTYILGGQSSAAQEQKVRKLITLGTPHMGSPVADWYASIDPTSMGDCTASDPALADYNWLLALVRSTIGLRPDALSFGTAVQQLQSLNNPFLDDLNARQRSGAGNSVKYYTIAGTEPLVNHEKFTYDGIIAKYTLDRPCSRLASDAVKEMIKEFLAFTSSSDSDGVVLTSSAYATGTGIRPVSSLTVPANHFQLTKNGRVWLEVLRYLTEWQAPVPKGTGITTYSPGYLHVYNQAGQHVGVDSNGQPEINIPGAVYKAMSDAAGFHEYIWVPETKGVRVEFGAYEDGTVGLDVSQVLADGLHWSSYQQLDVQRGSQITLKLDQANPTGELVHPSGETISITPTHNEFVSAPVFEPQGEAAATSPAQVGSFSVFFFASACIWVILAGGLFGVAISSGKQKLPRWLLPLLIGAATLCTLITCLLGIMNFGGAS